MKLALFLLALLPNVVLADLPFPIEPDRQLTPGTLCQKADEIRYPERIKYCRRKVSTYRKKMVIQTYDDQFGYRVGSMDRKDFKIDHYIPLCMGGGNDVENLWPQHKSVYGITDPVEPLLCDKMRDGKLRQVDAIDYLKRLKQDPTPEKAAALLSEINKI